MRRGGTGDRSGGLVLIVSPGGTAERGGMGRILANVTGHWARSGTGPAYRVIDPYGPRNLLVAPLYLAAALARILWLAATARVRLVHIHMASRGSVLRKGLVLLLAKAAGLPVLLHLHAGDFAPFFRGLPGPARRLVAGLFRMADHTIVLGRPWRDLLVDELGIAPERVSVMPNAVPRPDRPPRAPGQACALLYLGRLEDAKGVPELIEALADPRLARLAWRACLAGGGEVARFRAEVARRGLSDRIDCPGWQDEAQVARLLTDAEVLVLPSHHEGLSMAVLEALAAGLAVVATPVGAIPEAIEDGVSGLLVPPGDPAALAEALARVVAAPELRAALARGGIHRFNEKFEISAYCAQLDALYAALSRRPDRPREARRVLEKGSSH